MMNPDALDLERKSSAVTLSDMEIFVFPELMYGLLLANIMSPRLWQWRDDPWFAGIQKMKPYRRILRIKQYIIDHYIFNLDLDTWGLTSKPSEMSRFRDFIDEETLRQSNALFGYEGDKYYFDIDIRTHFGLDKYTSDIIPYWKTETVEAMDAFRHKPGYQTGAGECVSLSVLYAAALFVVAGIPLKDIFLLATPLHSQNFVDVAEGILTNNRRLVTRAMWFNGSALSAQARRALENERVTVVAHETGHIHVLYPEATIQPEAFERFRDKLTRFLTTELTVETLGSFLRQCPDCHPCFQVRWPAHGTDHYIPMERVFHYEQDSSFRLTDATRVKLMAEIDVEEFLSNRVPSRIVYNDLEDYVRRQAVDLNNAESVNGLKAQFCSGCLNADFTMQRLIRFCQVVPRLPDVSEKRFVPSGEPLRITTAMTREAVIGRLEEIRSRNPAAELAFYSYRDLNRTDWAPFLRAAMDRSPVSIEGAKALDDAALVGQVKAFGEQSIYDGPGRLAQPDEVWNYQRGDGAEKAILLANVLRHRHPERPITVEVGPDRAVLKAGDLTIEFPSAKQLKPATLTVKC